MDNGGYFIIFASIGIIVLVIIIFYFLQWIDLKIDYSNKNLQEKLEHIDGEDFLIVPYLIWQKGKILEIKQRYSEGCYIGERYYKSGVPYYGQTHEKAATDLLPTGLYRDFKVAIVPDAEYIGNSNMSNVTINGNNNHVTVHQNNINDISCQIERFLNNNENLTEFDSTTLQLFVYKIKDSSATKNDANKAVEILTKFLPLTTAIINLIKTPG